MTDDAESTTKTNWETNRHSHFDWMLPQLSTRWLYTTDGVPLGENALNEYVCNTRTPAVLLARFLAGRYDASISPGL